MDIGTWLRLMLVLSLAAAVAPAGQDPAVDFEIVAGQRMGPIGARTSEPDLIERFGAANVRRTDIHLAEGEFVAGTALYPDDPTRKLEIVWKDDFRSAPARIYLRGESSEWRTAAGLSLGSTLSEIEELNGGSFVMVGFGWDYSGTILHCGEGALTELGWLGPSGEIRDRTLVVRLQPPPGEEGVPLEQYRRVAGDREFLSSHPDLQKIQPRVYEMIVELAPGG